jgi:chorismate-pyruvate lyase
MSGISQPHVNVSIKPSATFDSWLHYDKPITDKLKRITGEAQLQLLSQEWKRSTGWDAHIIHINERILQREIFMNSQSKVYWYARAVIPQTCYDIDPDFFDRLNRESIRNLIFDEPKVRRVNRLTYPVTNQNLEFYWVKKHLKSIEGICWARIAEFSFLEKGSFYLIEMFLPNIEELAL